MESAMPMFKKIVTSKSHRVSRKGNKLASFYFLFFLRKTLKILWLRKMEGIRKIHIKHKNIKEASLAWGDFLCAPRESPHALPTAAGSC